MNFSFIRKLFLLAVGMVAVFVLPAYSQSKKPIAPPQFRAITITTKPDAIIWLDGIRFGKSDKTGKLTVKTVPPGAHAIRVRADGFKEKTQPLTLAQKGEINVDLVKTSDEAELAYQEAERLTGVDRERSAAAYRKAIKARPAYAEAYLGLARMLLDSGDFDEAQKAIVSARKLRPGYAEASAVEGRIQKENGDEARAVAAFKRAIAEGKGFQPEAYAGLGLLFKEKAEGAGSAGNFDGETVNYTESAKNLRMALKQLSGAPDSIVIYQLLGLIYERQKRYADAIALYEEFLRIFPDTAEATAVRSFIIQLKKDMSSQN